MLDSVMSGRASGTRCHLNIAVKGATTFWVHTIVALMLLWTVAVSMTQPSHCGRLRNNRLGGKHDKQTKL